MQAAIAATRTNPVTAPTLFVLVRNGCCAAHDLHPRMTTGAKR
ncbi:hypothetical protein [Rhodococcus sp. NCIMB 12038]|nr:hypothetical protein [Rhodococcus sp. NCIMB 12038]